MPGLEKWGMREPGAYDITVRRLGFKAATDVFPEEPWPAEHRLRRLEGILLSAHRAGALDEVFKRIGELVLADLALILQGLPPMMCKRAEPETVARLRSMPVQVS